MGKRWAWLGVLTLAAAMMGCQGGAPTDTTAPTISEVQVNPSSLIEQGRQVTVQAKVTDDRSGVKSVTARITYPDGTETTEPMQQQSETDVWAVTFTAQWDTNKVGTDPTQWFVKVTVQASDRAGNQAQSPESRVRAAALGPPPPPF